MSNKKPSVLLKQALFRRESNVKINQLTIKTN